MIFVNGLDLLAWFFVVFSFAFWITNWRRLFKTDGVLVVLQDEDGDYALALELYKNVNEFEYDRRISFFIEKRAWDTAD